MESTQPTPPISSPTRSTSESSQVDTSTDPTPQSTPPAQPTDRSPASKPKEGKSRKWPLLFVLLIAVFVLIVTGYIYYQNTRPKQQAGLPQIPTPISITTTPPASQTQTAMIRETNGRVEYLEPILGYAFSYLINPNYTIDNCGDFLAVIYQPDQILPNSNNDPSLPDSDDPCGTHGVASLKVRATTSSTFLLENPFCTQEEGNHWTAELVTKTIQGKEASYCKRTFVGEKLYPGPSEFLEKYFANEEVVVIVSVNDLELSPLFEEILATFEFIDQNIKTSEEVSTLLSETIEYSPKSNWQTYTDKIAGFSIQYDPGSKVDDTPGITEKGRSVRILGCGYKNPQGGEDLCLPSYSIHISTDYDGGSRRSWLNRNNVLQKPYYMDWIIDGRKALVGIEGNPGGSSWGFVAIPNGNNMFVYNIYGASWDPETGKLPDLSRDKLILSTFKFTN